MKTNKKEKYTQEFLENLYSIDDFYQFGIDQRSINSKYNSRNVIGKHQPNGKLTILKFIPNGVVNGETAPLYLCKCDCGRLTLKKCNHVINETVSTCGSCVKSKYSSKSWVGVELNGYRVIDIGYTNQVMFKIECLICHKVYSIGASAFCNGTISKCECTRHNINNKAESLRYIRDITIIGSIPEIDEVITDKFTVDNIEYYKTACSKCYLQKIRLVKDVKEHNFGNFVACICKRERSNRNPRGDTAGTRKFSALNLTEIVGKKQGKLMIKELNWNGTVKSSTYTCDCECGTKDIKLDAVGIISGKTHECGRCLTAPNAKYSDKKYIGQVFWGNLKVKEILVENSITYWICDCLRCGSKNNKITAHGITYGNNKSCGCLNSYGEQVIRSCLEENSIKFKSQVSFEGLTGLGGGKLKFDFIIYKGSKPYLALEYDGEQHFNPVDFSNGLCDNEFVLEQFRKIQMHDNMKNKYCSDNGIFIHRFSGQITSDDVLSILNKYKIIGGKQDA